MKVLYYCPEYYCLHGGRAHARGFFSALENLPSVSECFLYPKTSHYNDPKIFSKRDLPRAKLWFIPPTIRQIIYYFVPRWNLTRALIQEIKSKDCDTLVIRTGLKLPVINQIKRACPDTTVCLEINSAYFEESFPDLPFKSVFQKWEVKRFFKADVIMVVSAHLKSYLEKFAPDSKKIMVNQNGVSTTITNLSGVKGLRDKFNIPEDSFVIGYIGGMESFRRLPEVVAYFAELRRSGNDDLYFLIVGDGEDMAAVQHAIDAQSDVLKDSIKLTGWVPHSEVPRYLATFDIAVFPFTNSYCSPLKLFEYLGVGLPTIGPDTQAVKEVFQDRTHLLMVNQDGSDFMAAILELKNDPGLRSKLSNRGQQLVLKEYTWDKNAQRLIGFIQSVHAK